MRSYSADKINMFNVYILEAVCVPTVPIKLTCSMYSSVVCNAPIFCKVRLCNSNRNLNHKVLWRTKSF